MRTEVPFWHPRADCAAETLASPLFSHPSTVAQEIDISVDVPIWLPRWFLTSYWGVPSEVKDGDLAGVRAGVWWVKRNAAQTKKHMNPRCQAQKPISSRGTRPSFQPLHFRMTSGELLNTTQLYRLMWMVLVM